MSEKDFDLICIGRSCVDLYSGEFGVPLERAMTFTKSVGGSPMNIAIGTSRLGLRVGAITGVGQEDNGRYLKWQLSCEGVDVSAVKTDPKRLTAMVLLSIRGDNDFPLIQYRENCADMGLTAEDIDPDYLARAGAVLVTGTHLSREGVRSATMKVLETAKRLGLKCILDIDFRPNLWGLQGHDAGSSRWAEASEQVTSEYKKVLPYFDLIVGTEEEFFIAITGVGQEDNGRYLKWQLSCEGVDVSAVKTDPKRLTAMVLLSIRGDNDFPLIQYRENCADMGLTAEDIDPDYLARAGAVLVTGTHLSREGVRSATMKVLETAKRLGLKCILDIDFRPNLWGLQGHDAGSSRWAEASEQVTSEYKKVLPYFDLIVGTEEEFFIAGGKTEAMEALREVRRLSKALLVFKLGDKGCAALPGDIPDSFVDEVVYPGFPVKVFNSIGAGDGFMSGFLRGWLRNEDLASCCRYANAAGAFAVSRLGCSSAYPSWTELQYFVSHGSKHKWLREDAMLEQIHWATNRRNKWKNLAVFAFDHREPFSALAAETGRDAKAITAFKNLAFRAVAEASSELEGQNDVGILVDDTYGQSVLFESNRYPFWVGRSIEKTGVNPLMFEGKADVGSTLQAWPENHVVKCLFRPGAKDAPEVVEENERQLCRLFSGARSTGHDLLLEIIVDQPQTREEQDACLLRWMRRCYELGVYPDYWKILPVADQGTWQAIEALIGEYDPYCRGILFLGLNVAEAELVKRFAALPESPRALGFAIGRSIFLEPARKWFAGQMSDEDAVATMRDCFLRLARAWNGRNRG